MKKTIYTLLISGLISSTALAWGGGDDYIRPGKVFKTQSAVCRKEKDEHYNERLSLLGKKLSAATVEFITPTDLLHESSALLHLKYFETYPEASVDSFYVTPNRTKLTEQSENFNGLEENPWASIVVKSNSRAMEISIFAEEGKENEPEYAQVITDALNFLVYDYAVRVRNASSSKLETIKIEDGNSQTEKGFAELIKKSGGIVYNGLKVAKYLSMRDLGPVWKMEFVFDEKPTGALTKVGSGSFNISAPNVHQGPTVVNEGVVTGKLPPKTALTVNAPGEYHLTGNQTIASLTGNGIVNRGKFVLTITDNNDNNK